MEGVIELCTEPRGSALLDAFEILVVALEALPPLISTNVMDDAFCPLGPEAFRRSRKVHEQAGQPAR